LINRRALRQTPTPHYTVAAAAAAAAASSSPVAVKLPIPLSRAIRPRGRGERPGIPKKSVSYAMPKLKHKFNQIRLPSKREWCDGKGNPTRSVLVDMLMSHAGQLQTRGQVPRAMPNKNLRTESLNWR